MPNGFSAGYLNALDDTLEHEGGWSNHPNDPGGKTFRGVTKKAYERYLGRRVEDDELRNLSEDQIRQFYYKEYWRAARCDELPRGVSAQVFDVAVNSGPRRAIFVLQDALRALGAKISRDGRIGPQTISTARAFDVQKIINEIGHQRLSFYGRLIDARSTLSSFRKGWRRRVVANATFATKDRLKQRKKGAKT